MTEPANCSHDCGTCPVGDCDSRSQANRFLKPNEHSHIKHVIGVVSGKGGVGKSLVTSLLAAEATRKGKKVAILDADVTGPTIPRTFGLIGQRLTGDKNGIIPAKTKTGIKVVSTNLMLPKEDTPVAWRGPVITGIIHQFWQEVNWGDIDYMFVDMPPGTSDVFLTVFQSLPVDGIVTVSAPQELVEAIVGKAVNLSHDMHINVLGLVENMAYYTCTNCGEKQYIFGKPQGADVAKRYDIPAYATLPLDPEVAKLCDDGRIEDVDVKDMLDPIFAQIDALPDHAVETDGAAPAKNAEQNK